MKVCDSHGCLGVAKFHGFGRSVCWSCYSELITRGGFYSLTRQSIGGIITSKPANAEERQMQLWEEGLDGNAN